MVNELIPGLPVSNTTPAAGLIPGLPVVPGTTPPTATPAQNDPIWAWLESEGFYYDPDMVNAFTNLLTALFGAEGAQNILDMNADQFRINMEFKYAQLEQQAKDAEAAERQAQIVANAATRAAQISADASVERARIAAEATLEAARINAEATRYAADRALEATQLQVDARLEIAANQLALEAQRIASDEFGAPSDWIKRSFFMRERGLTEEDVSPQGIAPGFDPSALAPLASGATGGAAAPPPAQAPAPGQAIVSGGPELVTPTQQGVQFQPLSPFDEYRLRNKGVPTMDQGGFVRFGGSRYGPPGPNLPQIGRRWGIGSPQYRRALAGRGRGGIPPSSDPTTEPPPVPPPVPPPPPAPSVIPEIDPDEAPFLQYLRSGQRPSSFQAWTGPRTLPGIGIDKPVPAPHEVSLVNYDAFSASEQMMIAGVWRALGMISYATVSAAREAIMRAAPLGAGGTGQGAVGFG